MCKFGEQKQRRSPGRKGAAKPQRAGREIPRKESIVAVDTVTSPKGRRYTILETDQMDPYDHPTPTTGAPASNVRPGRRK
jgi:hypothetical protein